MKLPRLLLALALFAGASAWAQDDPSVKQESEKVLGEIAALPARDKALNLRIEAHTDNVGKAAANDSDAGRAKNRRVELARK